MTDVFEGEVVKRYFTTQIGELHPDKIYELVGPRRIGKTVLALSLAQQVIDQNGTVLYINCGGDIDMKLIGKLGIRLERLLIASVTSVDKLQELLNQTVKTGAVDLIVVDSVYDLYLTYSESGDKEHIFSKAMKDVLSEFAPLGALTYTGLLLLNDEHPTMHGKKRTYGGYAVEYLSAVRWKLEYLKKLSTQWGQYGNKVCVKVIKNLTDLEYVMTNVDIVW